MSKKKNKRKRKSKSNPQITKKRKYKRNRVKDNETKERNRIKHKREAIDYLGGECKKCGLRDDNLHVYDFHHRDPSKKHFGLSGKFKSNSVETLKPELDKCDLLCSNCHRKEHTELLRLPRPKKP